MNPVVFILTLLALAGTQLLAGGRTLALCLPGYGILAVAALITWWPSRRLSIPRGAVETLAASVLFFGYVTVRALYSPEEYLARKDLYMALGAMALYLLVALNLPSPRWRGWFVAALLLLGTANCILGLLQFAKGENLMLFSFLPRPDYGPRASGFYGYPNHLALFLEVSLMMGLGVAVWGRWRPWMKLFAGYCCLVCAFGILLTGSRGGYLGVVAGLVAFGLLSLRLVGKFDPAKAFSLIAAGCLVFGLGAWGVNHMLSKSMVLQSRVEQKTSSDVRLLVWHSAWQQFKLHPVAGTGSGTFLYYGRQFRHPLVQDDPVHSHNEYLELLAEYGILGVAAALMFLDTHLRQGWDSFTRQITREEGELSIADNSLGLTAGAISAVVACMAHSLVDFTLHMPANMLTMAFIFGVLANSSKGRNTVPGTENAGLPAFLRLALPALGLWIGIKALPTFPAEYYAEKARTIISDWQYMESEKVAQGLLDLTQRGIAADPRNPELYRFAAMAQNALSIESKDETAKAEWTTKALASYEKAMRLAPGDTRFVLGLASSLDDLERYADADPLYKRALELDPRSASVHFAYAEHLESAEKLEDAWREYKISLNLGGGESAQAGLDDVTEDLKAQLNAGPKTPPQAPKEP